MAGTVFAHPVLLNSGAPIAPANFIFTKPKTFCFGYMWGCLITPTHDKDCPTNGAPLYKKYRYAKFSHIPLRPFCCCPYRDITLQEHIFYEMQFNLMENRST